MRTYSDAQLNAMKNTEPDRYFYYSHEEMFRNLGINLENGNWEMPLIYDDEYEPSDNRFVRFRRIMESKNGVTMVSTSGNLIRIKAPEFKEEILALSDENAEAHAREVLKPEPEGLGIGFYILRVLSLGFYGGERYKAYKAEKRKYEESKADYAKKEKERKEEFAGYNANLQLKGKNRKDVDNYLRSERVDLEAEEAKSQKINSSVSEIRIAVERREAGRANLDFIMGQKKEDAEKVKENLLKEHYLGKEAFEKSNDPNTKKDYILNVDFPKDTKFSEHEIALLGLAATGCLDVQKTAMQYPIPGEDAVMDEKTAEKKAFLNGAKWYNFTDAIFNRQARNASAAAPLFNHAKLAVSDALNKYKDGDYSGLGEILKNGLRQCSRMVMGTSSIQDGSTWVDYCVYTKEMLAMADKDEKLKEAIIKAGFTAQDLKDAITCSNIGVVYERGINAQYKLNNELGLTPEEKAAAATEIVELRALQQMFIKHDNDLHKGPEYKEKEKLLLKEHRETQAERRNAYEKYGKDSPELKKIMERMDEISLDIGNLPFGYMADYFGYKISFGETLEGFFGSVGSVEKFHNHVCENVNLKDFGNMTGRNIIYKLLPGNADIYVSQIYPKDNELKPEKNLENKKEMQDVKGKVLNA